MRVSILTALLSLEICKLSAESPASPPATSPGRVTFYRDVQPILQDHCQTCHRPGEIAPMPFLTYRQTRPWAKAIRAEVLSRKMPPWFADPHYGRFANDPSPLGDHPKAAIDDHLKTGQR